MSIMAARANVIHAEIEARDAQKESLENEKKELREKLRDAEARDTEAKNALISVQTRIAEHTGRIEEKKQEIMDLLGSRGLHKSQDPAL